MDAEASCLHPADWPLELQQTAMLSLLALTTMLLAACYTWAIAQAAVPPGRQRLPALAAIHAVPLLFRQGTLSRIAATFLAVRLTSGKLIAFVLGRGVLVLPLSLLQFCAVMLAPFMPAQLMVSPSAAPVAAAADPRSQPAAPEAGAAGLKRRSSSQLLAGLYIPQWLQLTPTQRFSIDSATPAPPGQHLAPASGTGAQPPKSRNTQPTSAADNASTGRGSTRLLAACNLLLNAAVVVAFLAYTCGSRQRFVSAAASLSCLGLMWQSMQLLMRACSIPADTWLGLRLAPHFRNPYVAASLTDFWARRWNITQGLVLRFMVYEPIVDGRLVAEPAACAAGVGASRSGGSKTAGAEPAACKAAAACAHGPVAEAGASCTVIAGPAVRHTSKPSCGRCPPAAPALAASAAASASAGGGGVPVLAGPSAAIAPQWRRQLAAAATFVVSGLEHELFLAYATHRLGWHWLAFFTLQGVLLAAEGSLRRQCRQLGLALRPQVASLAVLLVLGVTGDALFWGPLKEVLLRRALWQPLIDVAAAAGLVQSGPGQACAAWA